MSKLTFNPITEAIFWLSGSRKVVLGTNQGVNSAVIDDNCTVSVTEYGVYLSVLREGFKMNVSFDAAVIEHKNVTFWQCVLNNFSKATHTFEDLGLTSPEGKIQSVSYKEDQIVVNAVTENGLSYEVHSANAFPLYKGYID